MTSSRTLVLGSSGVVEDRQRHGIFRRSSGVLKVTGPDLGLYSVGRSDRAI